ncbi:MAG TPA: DUF1653 domain-containing protein [Candidatus Acidoferrum sp.]|nr:DUF1653 domain-containing protein [Candidatus Acidoferrum sp.]
MSETLDSESAWPTHRPKEQIVNAYEGAGIYRHYKGDCYRVIGIGKHESTHVKVVIYHSYNVEHEVSRWIDGVDFVCRPLNAEDGDDAFNTRAANGMPRFVKLA